MLEISTRDIDDGLSEVRLDLNFAQSNRLALSLPIRRSGYPSVQGGESIETVTIRYQ